MDKGLRKAMSRADKVSAKTGQDIFVVYDVNDERYTVCTENELDTYFYGEKVFYAT